MSVVDKKVALMTGILFSYVPLPSDPRSTSWSRLFTCKSFFNIICDELITSYRLILAQYIRLIYTAQTT